MRLLRNVWSRRKIEIFEELLIVNGCNSSYSCLYSFIVDFHLLKVKLTKERMHPYNVWIIINVSLLKVKLIRKKIEIFEEMLIVNVCDASYCCLYCFIVDFHPLKVGLSKERMHEIQCEDYSNVSLLKVKLMKQKIEIFEEILIVNGCEASYCCLYSFIVDFHPLKVELTKDIMHPIQCEAFKQCLISQKNWKIRRTAYCKWMWCIL